MPAQRMRVEGLDAWWVLGCAVAAAIGTLAAGVSPTGWFPGDLVLVGGGTALAVWGAASAPWWAGVVAAAIGAVFSPSWVGLAFAAAAAAAGLAIGVSRRSVPWSRALVAAASAQALARLGSIGPLGMSAAIAIVTLGALAVLGVRRRPRHERKLVWRVTAVLAGLLVVASLGFGVAGASARPDLEQGVDSAQRALDQLADGDFDAAAASFTEAAERFGRAEGSIGGVLSQPARFVPVVAQHRNAADELLGTAAAVSTEVAGALAQIDVDALRVSAGRIDVAAVAALDAPLQQLRAALDRLAGSIESIESPWLVERLTLELDQLVADIDSQRVRGDNVIRAVQLAPELLGSAGPRRYFIAFTTPVEARGVGGFMGNYAEVTIVNGKITVSGFGRHTDLSAAGGGELRLDGPADFIDMWGDTGFRNADGRTRFNIWADITASPHFPSVAEVIAQLYPQSGGDELDGVFLMDVYAVSALMQITGAVEVVGTDVTVTPENAASFLLREQYLEFDDNPERIDALETVALTTVQRLLTAELPSPPDLAELMSPFVRQGRLLAWSAVPAEQELFAMLRMDGALPDPGTGDGLAVAFNNAGNSKIDLFLTGEATYDVRTDADADRVDATLTMLLRNDAPASGLPDYVIANYAQRPIGTNLAFVTVYTRLDVTSVTTGGEEVGIRERTEAGYRTTSFFTEIGPGDELEVVVAMSGTVDDPTSFARQLTWRSPPMVTPMGMSVIVDGTMLDGSPVTSAGVYRLG